MAGFAQTQIQFSNTYMGILRQAESGVPVSELCREHGMSSASFYKWRAKFGGVDASIISEMKAQVCRTGDVWFIGLRPTT